MNEWKFCGVSNCTMGQTQIPDFQYSGYNYDIWLVYFTPVIYLIGKVFTNGPGRVIPKSQKNGTWCCLA